MLFWNSSERTVFIKLFSSVVPSSLRASRLPSRYSLYLSLNSLYPFTPLFLQNRQLLADSIRLLYKREVKEATGKTLFVLDEPTTGLHTDDIKRLLAILQKIVDNKDTVVVIEHNLDVIKVADYIIDLGPEGGDEGGQIVATGTPEEVAKVKESYTGQFLKKIL